MNASIFTQLTRCHPRKPLTVLALLWLAALSAWVVWEWQRPALPPVEPTLSASRPPPPRPSFDERPEVEAWSGTPTPNPFRSPYFETRLLARHFDARASEHLPIPSDPVVFEPESIPNTEGYAAKPERTNDTDHLRYRGWLKLATGAPVAFIEDRYTGTTRRYRIGDRIEDMELRVIDRTRIELATDQGASIALSRSLPPSPDAPSPEDGSSAETPPPPNTPHDPDADPIPGEMAPTS